MQEDEWLSRNEAAAFIGVRPNTMNIWKIKGKPHPKHYKINGKLRFKKSDLIEFIESKLVR